MWSVAARSIPMGTAYAVWGGIGALGTVIVGIGFFGEPATTLRLLLLLGLVGCIVGLRVARRDRNHARRQSRQTRLTDLLRVLIGAAPLGGSPAGWQSRQRRSSRPPQTASSAPPPRT